MPNDEVLKRVDERRILIKTTAERSSSMIAHPLLHSILFKILIEERNGRRNPRHECTDEIKGGRRYMVIKG